MIVVLFSFVWFVDWTDRFILKEALGFSTFFKIGFCAKEFRFFRLGVHYDLRIFHSLAFGSIFQPPLISNSCETSVFSTCQNRIRSIRVLRTRMWTFIGFACGFRFWSNFFCSFSVVDDSTALRFLINPLILPCSGVPHGFLLCKLKISHSKITDLPFRSVPCHKLE